MTRFTLTNAIPTNTLYYISFAFSWISSNDHCCANTGISFGICVTPWNTRETLSNTFYRPFHPENLPIPSCEESKCPQRTKTQCFLQPSDPLIYREYNETDPTNTNIKSSRRRTVSPYYGIMPPRSYKVGRIKSTGSFDVVTLVSYIGMKGVEPPSGTSSK